MIGNIYNFELALAKIHIFTLKNSSKIIRITRFLSLNLKYQISLIRINLKTDFSLFNHINLNNFEKRFN